MVRELSLNLQECSVGGGIVGGGTGYLDIDWASPGRWAFDCGVMRAGQGLSGNKAWAGVVAGCAATDALAEDTGCDAAA